MEKYGSDFLNTLSVTFHYKKNLVGKEELIDCNTRLSIFLGWHKVMESIDCALELGYDPVKVSFS